MLLWVLENEPKLRETSILDILLVDDEQIGIEMETSIAYLPCDGFSSI